MARMSCWMRPGQAAARLGMTRSGVVWLCDTGKLKCRRMADGWRFVSSRDVERLLATRAMKLKG